MREAEPCLSSAPALGEVHRRPLEAVRGSWPGLVIRDGEEVLCVPVGLRAARHRPAPPCWDGNRSAALRSPSFQPALPWLTGSCAALLTWASRPGGPGAVGSSNSPVLPGSGRAAGFHPPAVSIGLQQRAGNVRVTTEEMAQKLWGEIGAGESNPHHFHALRWDAAWAGGAPRCPAQLLAGETPCSPKPCAAHRCGSGLHGRRVAEHPPMAAPWMPAVQFITLVSFLTPKVPWCGGLGCWLVGGLGGPSGP